MKKDLTLAIVCTLIFIISDSWTYRQTENDKPGTVKDKDGSEIIIRIRNVRSWEKKRRQIISNMQIVMGPLPEKSKKVPLEMEVISEETLNEVKRLKIKFSTEKDDKVTAYLLIPEGLTGSVPGILCLHQTTKIGKAEPAGLGGSSNLYYALELAERGYVTLAPDYPNFGDYIFDPYSHGYESATMKGIWNHMAAVDLLQSLPEIDADRIGCIGHSLGGHNSLFLAAFDKRIKAVVTSCGFNSFHKYFGGNLTGWSHKGYMPKISTVYGTKPEKMPFDFTDVLASIAPRAVFINAPLYDSNFDIWGVHDCVNAAKPVYELLKAPEKLVFTTPEAQHDFPPATREAAYLFLDRELKFDMNMSIRSRSQERESAAIDQDGWLVGLGRRIITPRNDVWLAGYGTKRAAENTIHDLWVKVMALKSPDGKRIVMATTDHMGMSRAVYESIYTRMHRQYGINRHEFMITYSHNHSGPCLTDDLVDYYPSDEAQRKTVKEYTAWMEKQVIDAAGEALSGWQPAILLRGEGKCTFAVNRRDNPEKDIPEMIEKGIPFKGVVDHYVPVLAIKSMEGNLLATLFGYACHPTTLSGNSWCGDYPGFAQINIEARFPGTSAMFFNACGADQNPLPRRKLELCEKYGKMLSDAVEEVLAGPMEPVSTGLSSSFRFVDLAYDESITREKMIPIAKGGPSVQSRWANRMLKLMDDGIVFPKSYSYPVQAWQIGTELLLIGIGGESVIDYSLRFKKEYGPGTWVCGYANDMAAYIPSRRVWEEGGYEGGPHLDEYGRPAWRWAGDIEDRISFTVNLVVKEVKEK